MTTNFGAVGMVEFTSIASGMTAADSMVKTAHVTPLFFKTICPGKFLTCITGNVAAVNAAIEAGRAISAETVADWFIIPNIHPDVARCLAGGIMPVEQAALGVVETYSAAAAVEAADAGVKAANVQIMDIRTALGLGGKGYTLFVGDVAAVEAAVEAATRKAADNGMVVGTTVIPRPSPLFFEQIL